MQEKRDGTFVANVCVSPLVVRLRVERTRVAPGGPACFAPIEGHLGTKTDFKLILPRAEYHCIRCGGHQGHVFKDGPQPTGQRSLQQRCRPLVRARRGVTIARAADLTRPDKRLNFMT